MSTVRQIINSALALINVKQIGENPSASETEVAQGTMNAMLESWGTDSLNIHKRTAYTFILEPTKASYTIGPEFDENGVATGADWVVTRPLEIEKAKLILGDTSTLPSPTGQNNIYLDVEKLDYQQFSDIARRNLQTSLQLYFYDDGQYPLRTFTVWPVATLAREIELWLWEPLLTYTTLDEEVSLPPGYERAITYNLAIELAAIFMKQVAASVSKVAVDSLAEIQRLNQLQVQMNLTDNYSSTKRHGKWNWITGTYGWNP